MFNQEERGWNARKEIYADEVIIHANKIYVYGAAEEPHNKGPKWKESKGRRQQSQPKGTGKKSRATRKQPVASLSPELVPGKYEIEIMGAEGMIQDLLREIKENGLTSEAIKHAAKEQPQQFHNKSHSNPLPRGNRGFWF